MSMSSRMSRRSSVSYASVADYGWESIFPVPEALGEITSYLNAATDLEQEYPARVSYLCRRFAYARAMEIDPLYEQRGVMQFMTTFYHLLTEDATIADEHNQPLGRYSDVENAREMEEFYRHFYKRVEDVKSADSQERAFTYNLASVLYKTMNYLQETAHLEVPTEDAERNIAVEKKAALIVPFNILPLETPEDSDDPIMRLTQVRSAVAQIRNIKNLPYPRDGKQIDSQPRPIWDVLDWLGFMFGFQKDNVRNQREHVVMLLASTISRVSADKSETALSNQAQIEARALRLLTGKTLENYVEWCSFLGQNPNLIAPDGRDPLQFDILCTCLFYLIWGEASNLRLLGECLCYIYLNMVKDLHTLLRTDAGSMPWASLKTKSGYSGQGAQRNSGPYAFLEEVIKPIYNVARQEADNNRHGKAPYATWRTYDDLNEFFWTERCFELQWPWKQDHGFFTKPMLNKAPSDTIECFPMLGRAKKKTDEERTPLNPGSGAEASDGRGPKHQQPRCGKTLFVEHRTVWHVMRSFSRMWLFYTVALQAMIIIAWHQDKNDLGKNWQKLLSILCTVSGAQLFQVILDILMLYGAYGSMKVEHVVRIFAKLIVTLAWFLALTGSYYFHMNPGNNATDAKKAFWKTLNFLIAGAYVGLSAFGAVIFRVPLFRRILDQGGCTRFPLVRMFKWWYQARIYVGRNMYETSSAYAKYSLFWIVLLVSKLVVSYFFQVKPLIAPTRVIVNLPSTRKACQEIYRWADVVSCRRGNLGTVIALWSPVMMVYMMDVNLWYAAMESIVGIVDGARQRLGEIRELTMLRRRFMEFPLAFASRMMISRQSFDEGSDETNRKYLREIRFAQVWNDVIDSFREEDIISDQERLMLKFPTRSGLLQMPFSVTREKLTQWPLFLLANQVYLALDVCKKDRPSDADIWNQICKVKEMQLTVIEIYASIWYMLHQILSDDTDLWVVRWLHDELDKNMRNGNMVKELNLKGGIGKVHEKLVSLVNALLEKEGTEANAYKAMKAVMDFFETVKEDLLGKHARDSLLRDFNNQTHSQKPQVFTNIRFPVTADLREQLVRFRSLLTIKESVFDMPTNLEARRRLTFFCNSLFMNMPKPPPVDSCRSFCVLTPYYNESVAYSQKELQVPNEDGITIIFYLQKIYKDEWTNFLERLWEQLGPEKQKELKFKGVEEAGAANEENADGKGAKAGSKGKERGGRVEGDRDTEREKEKARENEKERMKKIHKRWMEMDEFEVWKTVPDPREVCMWASYHSQTLSRTIRGMLYYHRALKVQAFLDAAPDDVVERGYAAARANDIVESRNDGRVSLAAQCQALADLKFVYVVTAQRFGSQKKGKKDSKDRAIYNEILRMMEQHSALRIAYIDDGEENTHSVLVKYDRRTQQDQEVYRIKLPGKVVLGEGKPENQNHAIVFTRGDAVQAIDMNQDNYLEEAMKMRNLLEEFDCNTDRHKPTILGVREHIFTSGVSSIATFMSAQELAFVTIGQRVLSRPLRVRMHYGHPDVFDRLFHITRGGMSKASKTINVSEDIYAGFNSTLRGGSVTHHEYIQVGKGRDVGLNQISMFEAKVSAGNSEQVLSRDVYRLGHMFDFFRMLSFYYNTVGFYISTLMIVLTVYFFLYGRVYMALSGVEKYLLQYGKAFGIDALISVLNAQLLVQIGMVSAIPMLGEFMLERGFFQALLDFGTMFMHLSMVFFTFSMGTKSHYFGRTLVHGGAKYRATGRGFVVAHIPFAENYRLFSRSHFTKGLEIVGLLSVYLAWSPISKSLTSYIFLMVSTWFLAFSWLFAPFIFNPSGFDWQKCVDDFDGFVKWLFRKGGIGVDINQSWERWFEDEHEHIHGFLGRFTEILLSSRFFLFQFGVVYSLNISGGNKSYAVYGFSWLLALSVIVLLKVNGILSKRAGENLRTTFRVLQFFVVCGMILALVLCIKFTNLTVSDVFACILAYGPTGWGIVQIAVALKPLTKKLRLWGSIRKLARFYDAVFGFALFTPLAMLSWFPFSSTIQTRLLFNQAFSRGLEISLILAGNRPNQ